MELSRTHQDLFELIAIPSISTLPEHKQDIMRAADWLKQYLVDSGIPTENIQFLHSPELDTEKHHPVVFGQLIANPNNPTVLVYGHYDVQPVDPIDQWQSDPFKAEVRDGFIYARGATDDKGQLMTQLAAVREFIAQAKAAGNELPLNFKFLIEGEEENGGENIEHIIKDPKFSELLKADICLVSDGPWVDPQHPTIEYGLRGITYAQINVRLADSDMHSGLFGGGVLNPINALTQILAQLQDRNTGKVLIPGFYDDVVDISDLERQKIAAVPYSEEQFLHDAKNAKAIWGEQGYSVAERTSARPTFDINGIWGGFQGVGAKTVIPATAHAKVSMRLVANQEPQKIFELLKNYVAQIALKEVDVEVELIHGGDAMLAPLDSPYIQKAAQALQETFGVDPVYARSGGSIPAIALMQSKLGVTPILLNYGFGDDGMHGPNERFSMQQFEKGIQANLKFLQLIS
jgi:acetylornithine deacetylase/succinyl-diaminopimelate desuccinylase-like protein